jgi:hypothetical protein
MYIFAKFVADHMFLQKHDKINIKNRVLYWAWRRRRRRRGRESGAVATRQPGVAPQAGRLGGAAMASDVRQGNCQTQRRGVAIFLYIYFSRFCKNIWSGINLAKIYIWRRVPRRPGHNAVGHGARCRQEWALSRNAKGHGVSSLSSWPVVLGA